MTPGEAKAQRSLKARRSRIPKHRMNVRTLPLSISIWRKGGRHEQADRAQNIYDHSVRELLALGEKIGKQRANG